MKNRPLFFLAIGTVMITAPDNASSQENSTTPSAITDPRFRNVLRSVKKDPEALLDSVPDDAEDSVRAATRIFSDKMKDVDTTGIDTPENRAKLEKLGNAAMARAKELTSDAPAEPVKAEVTPKADPPAETTAKPSPDKPMASPGPADKVPATRSAADSVRFVTPIAMPVDEAPPAPLAATTGAETVVQSSTVQPMSSAAPTEQNIPDSPALTDGEVPEPQPLKPKYNTKAGGGYQGADADHMQITARESTMDNNKGLLTFVGNVVVDHPEFEIKCEKLEIHMAEGVGNNQGGGSDPFKRAVASGGMVEIRRISPEGKTQIAMARRADYNATTKDIVLSGGPPYIQDGDRFVETSSPDAKIIMRGTGQYQITGSDAGPQNRTRIVIPVSGGKQSEDIGIPGLGSGIERLR